MHSLDRRQPAAVMGAGRAHRCLAASTLAHVHLLALEQYTDKRQSFQSALASVYLNMLRHFKWVAREAQGYLFIGEAFCPTILHR